MFERCMYVCMYGEGVLLLGDLALAANPRAVPQGLRQPDLGGLERCVCMYVSTSE